jgi:hypothetical protein
MSAIIAADVPELKFRQSRINNQQSRIRQPLPGWALACFLVVAPQSLPRPVAAEDLLSELAAKVTASVGSGELVQLVPPSVPSNDDAATRQILEAFGLLLTRGGLRVTDNAVGTAVVSFACSQNLRERVCAADIRRGNAHEIVVATRGHSAAPPPNAVSIPVVLGLQPVFAQDQPILDLALVGPRLLVLDPVSLTMYEKSTEGWRRSGSRPLAGERPWSRDMRGKLRVDSGRFESFLPGVACRGTLEPFDVMCAGDQRPWPMAIENDGIPSGRNAFAMSGGRTYFTVAPLGPDAGARWLAAADDGRLVFLDSDRRPLETMTGFGSEVAAIVTSCASGSHVLASPAASDPNQDTLQLFRVAGRKIVDATPPVVLAGRLTALWTTANGDGAIAVSRHSTTRRYEAFHIGVSCGR